MVSEERFRRFRNRAVSVGIQSDKAEKYVLDEIAKMKGFRGRKITRIVNKKKITADISAAREYADWLAKEEYGFRGKKKGEKIDGKTVETDISPFFEMIEYYRTRYKDKKGKPVEISPWDLIPEDDFIRYGEMVKNKWIAEHAKFIAFCNELVNNIMDYYQKNKTHSTAITMDDMFKTIDEYHRSHPGSMNIYTLYDLLIGLDYCLPEKNILARMTPNRKNIIFEFKENIPKKESEIAAQSVKMPCPSRSDPYYLRLPCH